MECSESVAESATALATRMTAMSDMCATCWCCCPTDAAAIAAAGPSEALGLAKTEPLWCAGLPCLDSSLARKMRFRERSSSEMACIPAPPAPPEKADTAAAGGIPGACEASEPGAGEPERRSSAAGGAEARRHRASSIAPWSDMRLPNMAGGTRSAHRVGSAPRAGAHGVAVHCVGCSGGYPRG